MKRTHSVASAAIWLPVLLLAFVVGSCRDDGSPTEPSSPSLELLAGEASPDIQRISHLITALFPAPGLINAAESHWSNIQRSMERGAEDAAREQVVGFISQTLDLLAEQRLLEPEANMGLPETTEQVLAELVLRLYAFVDLSSLEALVDYADFFESTFVSQDSGFGVIDAETGGVVTSANGWSRVTALPGSTGETVFVQMQLLDGPTCAAASALTQALGCWEIDRYPAGDFLQDVTVEVCVADPGAEVMTDYEYYVAQRLHRQDETTLEITALPLVNSGLDCTGFPLGAEATQVASADGGHSLLSALGSGLADLFLPDPLAAHVRDLRRPPRGLGGLVGSFSWFFGAVPEEPEYARLPIGSGPTASWTVEEPTEGIDLCSGPDGIGCPEGSVPSLEISAVAEGSTADAGPPWWRVFLFYRPADESEAPTLIGRADYAGFDDNGSERYYSWTITLEGTGLPEGLLDIYAVGVRNPGDGGAIFGTGLVSYITTVPPLECYTQTEIPSAECEALAALYNSTTGDEWVNNTNWLDYANICEWFGVTCDMGAVTVLDLRLNGLNGPIPAQLGNLSDLLYLDLDYNQLTGLVPPELGNLSNLEVLHLSGSQQSTAWLTGSIPPELGNLSHLTSLYLGGNQLTGSIPPELGNLHNLEELALHENKLSGAIPVELGNLGSLVRLWLEINDVSGPIPAELGNLGNLEMLYLFFTQVTGPIPPELGNLSNLKGLQLHYNQLVGPIPPELGNLENLITLNLVHNQLGGSIPPELGNLNYLQRLGLGECNLSGSIPAELGNLSSLTELGLSGNQLSGTIPPEFGNLGMLSRLDLGNNQLSGTIPAGLGDLTNLWYLDLQDNQLSGSIPAELGNLFDLERLDLSDNQLSGALPAELGGLGKVRWFFLQNNQLSGSIPGELGTLGNLATMGPLLYLHLENNQLSGAIPAGLGNLTNLRDLYLQDNQLTGLVPIEVAVVGGSSSVRSCTMSPGNAGLYMPDSQAYRDADQNGDGWICGLRLSSDALSLPSLEHAVSFEDLIQEPPKRDP